MRLPMLASLAAVLAPSVAGAQNLPVDLAFSEPLVAAGDTAYLRLQGPEGHLPLLLISRVPGPSYLPGVGELALSLNPFPTMVPLGTLPPGGSAELTCSFDCESPIVDMPCFLQVITIDPQTGQPSGISQLAVLNVASENCGVCPSAAIGDPECGWDSNHALWLPGIGTDFKFVAGASLVERIDGTASLTGVVSRESNPDESFWVDVDLTGRMNPGEAAFPPVDSPKLELIDAAYSDNGGPIMPGTWHYYSALSGELVGLADFEGARLELERAGPAFQVGFGANGKNKKLGGSGWLTVSLLHHPHAGDFASVPSKGDFNLNLNAECPECPEEAGDHSFYLPGISKDFLFKDGAEFIELADGSAVLMGEIYDANDDDRCFDVSVVFANRIDPGTAMHPPAGSPKLELDSSDYVGGGGIVDPEIWRYYESTEGTLIGRKDLEGAELSISRMGPAFQVGLGASGKTSRYGASGWLDVELISQPKNGPALPADPPHGDINISITQCD